VRNNGKKKGVGENIFPEKNGFGKAFPGGLGGTERGEGRTYQKRGDETPTERSGKAGGDKKSAFVAGKNLT